MGELKLVKREDGMMSKDCCIGCKYDDFNEWNNVDEDPCYLCDASGSKRIPKEDKGDL